MVLLCCCKRGANLYLLRCLLLGVVASLIASCGGGGSSTATTVAPNSDNLAQICAKENPYVANATARTEQGTLADEKNWIKAYMTERYLWYRDMPVVNAQDSQYNVIENGVIDVWKSLLNYFSDSKTQLKTATGQLVDKFSFMVDTLSWNNYVGSRLRGYGFMLKTSTVAGAKVLTIAYVFPNTPAFNAGFLRGDQIVSIDGALTSDTTPASVAIFEEGLHPQQVVPHTFLVLRADSQISITVQAEQINLKQVEYKVLNVGTQKLGYLLFNSHVPNAETDLIQALNLFKQQAVTQMVVDLRYNGGGYLSIANALASAVAGPAKTAGKVFELTKFSDKRSAENEAMYFSNRGLNNQIYPSLGLSKIYVLVSGGTCSASESFINGLRGVDVQVELIGSTTCGKPYAYYPQDNCGITYAAMEMEGVNDKGEGGYGDGMVPQCTATDDLSRPLGDLREGMLSVVVRRIQGQSCAQSAGRALSSVGLQGMSIDSGGAEGVLLRPDWQNNKWLIRTHKTPQ